MTCRHVICDGRVLTVGRCPGVGGDALAVVEYLDGLRRAPDPDLLPQQAVRGRVVVLVHLYVVIEADGALLPFAEDIGLSRQGPQGGSLNLIEQVPAAGTEMPGHPVVQPVEEDADCGVQFREREESLIAQTHRAEGASATRRAEGASATRRAEGASATRQSSARRSEPPLRPLRSPSGLNRWRLDGSLSGFVRPCWHDSRAVMRSHVGVGPVHCRFVEAGLGHAGLRVHCPRTNGGQ